MGVEMRSGSGYGRRAGCVAGDASERLVGASVTHGRGGREVICSWATPIAVPGEIFVEESGTPQAGGGPPKDPSLQGHRRSVAEAHLQLLPRSVGVGTAHLLESTV